MTVVLAVLVGVLGLTTLLLLAVAVQLTGDRKARLLIGDAECMRAAEKVQAELMRRFDGDHLFFVAKSEDFAGEYDLTIETTVSVTAERRINP